MAQFKINQLEDVHRYVVAQEAMWLNADRTRLVAADDPQASFLFSTPGKRISRADAIRFGLVKADKQDKQEAAESPLVEGSVDAVLASVGDDKERAQEALAAEEAKPKKERRKTLIDGLKALIES
jgi:hypothetical protein